jgi:hypothetical protein
MTLRIMLVGLVASLGFELPSGSDVSCWAQAGQAWFQARVVDRSGPVVVEPKLDIDRPSDCQQVVEKCEMPAPACEKQADPDAAFKAVSEAIAADFSADLVANHREEAPADQVVAKVAIEEPAPVAVPESEEGGCLVVAVDEAKTAEVAWTEEARPAESVEPIVESPSGLDRVSSAVRLTREAVQAWAELMQQPVDE